MTSFCVLVKSEITAFMVLPEACKLRIGDFTEDGGACGACGGGEVGGAVVEGFVGEEGEGVGFFGLFGDGEFFGGKDGDWGEAGFELARQEGIAGAAARDDELGDFCF